VGLFFFPFCFLFVLKNFIELLSRLSASALSLPLSLSLSLPCGAVKSDKERLNDLFSRAVSVPARSLSVFVLY